MTRLRCAKGLAAAPETFVGRTTTSSDGAGVTRRLCPDRVSQAAKAHSRDILPGRTADKTGAAAGSIAPCMSCNTSRCCTKPATKQGAKPLLASAPRKPVQASQDQGLQLQAWTQRQAEPALTRGSGGSAFCRHVLSSEPMALRE